MKKRGLILSLISMIMLVSCVAQDKTVILSDDTSKDEELKYSVTSKMIKTDNGEFFIPGYYYEDKIYGALGKEFVYLDNYDGAISYYDTKNEKFNKLDRLDDTKLNYLNVPFYKKYINYETDEKAEYKKISVVDYITKDETEVDIFRSEKSENYNSSSEILDFVSGSDNYIYFRGDSTNDRTGEVCNELTIYDIEKKQNYYMKSTAGTEEFVDIKYIAYSKELDKLYGLTNYGEVCELKKQDNTIIPKVIYKIHLNSNEGIHYNVDFTESIITGENIIVTVTTADSNRYDNFKVINLRTLEEQELNEKFNVEGSVKGNSKPLMSFTFSSGYSILQLSSDSNEYAIINSKGEDIELIKKITVQKDFYISNAICSEEGKKILISVVNGKYDDKKQELIEFNIEKLY